MNSVITKILTEPEERSEAALETLTLHAITELSFPWN